MPQEPKRRHSKQRKGKRRASIHFDSPQVLLCPNCKAPIAPHVICKNCGFYKGKEVIHKKPQKKKDNE
jgi:large subunit ribosomal protein L32